MKASLKKIVDINEKELMYLQLETYNGDRIHINIGTKTWVKVQNLILLDNEWAQQGGINPPYTTTESESEEKIKPITTQITETFHTKKGK